MQHQCNISQCPNDLGPKAILCDKHFRALANRMQDWLNTRLEKNNGRFYPPRTANT